MMPSHRASLCILRVVVGDDKSIDGEGVCGVESGELRVESFLILSRHPFGEAVDGGLHILLGWVLNEFAFNGIEAKVVEPTHSSTPRYDRCGGGKRKRYPLDLSRFYFFRVFQRKGT